MRNFHAISTNVIVTFDRSPDKEVLESYDLAVSELANTLDLDRHRISTAMETLLKEYRVGLTSESLLERCWDDAQGTWKGTLYSFAPADLAVLARFTIFFRCVSLLRGTKENFDNLVFTYHNLNTGNSFIWAHVCLDAVNEKTAPSHSRSVH